MFVIPPSSSNEVYFNKVANEIWEISQKDKREMCESLISENNTMVIHCKINMENGKDSIVYFNFRYFKDILYCFIQEAETLNT